MLDQRTQTFLPLVEQTLTAYFAHIGNDHLREAMAYSVNAGGKRLRPLLLLATVDSFGGSVASALPAAAGLELLHTYSLIHDDLPAMDNDDLRRGRPTSHKQFGEATAILAGDALQSDALAMVASAPVSAAVSLALVTTLAQAAGSNGMVAGQVMDMDGETTAYDLPTLRHLHALKTGALIRAAVRMGGLLAAVDAATLQQLDRFATAFGVAFQIQDDLNDVTETAAELGKTANKDLAENKNTYPRLLGLAGAKRALAEQVTAARAALAPMPAAASQLTAFLTYFDVKGEA